MFGFFLDFVYLFLERGEGKEKGGRNLAHNPGMCPDWESNRRLCDLQARAEPQQPGQLSYICISYIWLFGSQFCLLDAISACY